MFEAIHASLTNNATTAFWGVVGFLILQNSGLILSGALSFYRKIKKMRKDINQAWLAIRIIAAHLKLDLGNLLKEENNKTQERKNE